MGKFLPLPCSKLLKRKDISLLEYYDKRNKVLIMRDTGGMGDILMMRMIFEDFKRSMPNAYIVFACPKLYHDLVKDHPFVDEVVDSAKVDITEYLITYNITSACGKYEQRKAPFADKHRSDIWAEHCGLQLTHHDMHLTVPDGVTQRCRHTLEQYRKDNKSPIVLFTPISAMRSKDLDLKQGQAIIDELQKLGCCVLCYHKQKLPQFNTETIIANGFIEFLGFINAANYIVTVDTATFHAAGGLKKPQVAVFGWADGKVYGKWYEKVTLVQRHRDNGNWDCGPCYVWWRCPKEQTTHRKPCITSIRPSEVIDAAKKMMQQWPIGREYGK